MALFSTKCTVDHKNTSYTFQNEEKKTSRLFENYSIQYYFVDVVPVWLTFKLFVTFEVVTCARE